MNTTSQSKTLEEIIIDLLNTQLEGQETIKYFAIEARTEIQALIEKEVINIDDQVFEQSPWKKDQEISMKNKVRNELRATQRQNLSKLIRGEES